MSPMRIFLWASGGEADYPMRHSYITLADDKLAQAIRIICVKQGVTLSIFFAEAARRYLAQLATEEGK
jgi:hypothetical protein